MRRVSGVPLQGGQLTSKHLEALGESLQQLHACVPLQILERMSPAGDDPATAGPKLRRRIAELSRPNEDPVVSAAFDAASAWLDGAEATALIDYQGRAAFARGDGNLANFLFDGDHVVQVDFEDSGRGDRAADLADLVEHISARGTPDSEWKTFLSRFVLDTSERRRLAGVRRMSSIFWLLLLLPGQPGHARNPPGALRRQAERVLSL